MHACTSTHAGSAHARTEYDQELEAGAQFRIRVCVGVHSGMVHEVAHRQEEGTSNWCGRTLTHPGELRGCGSSPATPWLLLLLLLTLMIQLLKVYASAGTEHPTHDMNGEGTQSREKQNRRIKLE